MPTDPTAARVAQIRERMAAGVWPNAISVVDDLQVALAVLAAAEQARDDAVTKDGAHLAQIVTLESDLRLAADRLAATEAARDHWQHEYGDCLLVRLDHQKRADAAEQARDEQRKDTEAWYRQVQVLNTTNDQLEQQLTAVEQARDAQRAEYLRQKAGHIQEVAGLRQLLTAAEQARDNLQHWCNDLEAFLAAAEQRATRLETALQEHGRHLASCAEHLTSGRLGCDCGLTEALAAPPAAEGEP